MCGLFIQGGMNVKTLIQSTLLVGLSLAICVSAQAQDTGNPPNMQGAIVVLDVALVFKSHEPFKQRIEAIQQKAEQLKAKVESDQQKLRADAQAALEPLKPNSADRQQVEAKFEQDMAALRTYARQAETNLMAEEATVYFETYQQMQTVVTEFAEAWNLALVLRFDSSPIEPTNRNSVIAGVNRAIVYHKDRDLTTHVINRMNERVGQAGTATNQK
jgi:Skp family chaperone for outer membrane proteins